jgi:hypothetical protein
VQRNVVQAFQRPIEHLRNAGNRLGVEHAVAHDAEPARALGDQDAAIRQERERIGP